MALPCAGGFTKPVAALIVGRVYEKLPRGVAFGHTRALVERGVGSAIQIIDALRNAGVTGRPDVGCAGPGQGALGLAGAEAQRRES